MNIITEKFSINNLEIKVVLMTSEFSENSVFQRKNINSDKHKIEKFGTSTLENLEIMIFL